MPQSWQRALYLPLIILAWLVIVLIGGWLLAHVAKTLLTLILSAITAFALTPLVSLVARGLPRPLAIAVAYVLGFGVVLGLLALVVATAATQITALVHHLPAYAQQAQRLEPRLLPLLRSLPQAGADDQHGGECQDTAHRQEPGRPRDEHGSPQQDDERGGKTGPDARSLVPAAGSWTGRTSTGLALTRGGARPWPRDVRCVCPCPDEAHA